jgi:hypothetical protein|tara:strand:- start:180 stop:395 length:216 start_codon:yes stop_codon:yes gene_type:complete
MTVWTKENVLLPRINNHGGYSIYFYNCQTDFQLEAQGLDTTFKDSQPIFSFRRLLSGKETITAFRKSLLWD